LFPVQTATQAGLAAKLNNVYVFGLPKDYTETYRAKSVAGVTSRASEGAASTLLGSENSVIAIVRHWAKVKDSARRVHEHHVPRPRRQADPAPSTQQ